MKLKVVSKYLIEVSGGHLKKHEIVEYVFTLKTFS